MVSPEDERVRELARRVREGSATDAEREELALYAEDSPESRALAVRAEKEGALGRGWVDRYEADRRLVAVERSPLSRAERKVGAGLVVGGALAALVSAPAGAALAGAGAVVLTWSVLRVALANRGKDPYGGIEE